jgi:hypothetical protein
VERARQSLQQALSLDPNFPDAAEARKTMAELRMAPRQTAAREP